jgi:hypothetical protein
MKAEVRAQAVSIGAFPEATRFGMDMCSLVMYGLQQSLGDQEGIRVRASSLVEYSVERGVEVLIGVAVDRSALGHALGFGWNTRVDWEGVARDLEHDPDLFERLLASFIVAEVRAHWSKRDYREGADPNRPSQRYNDVRHGYGWYALDTSKAGAPWGYIDEH